MATELSIPLPLRFPPISTFPWTSLVVAKLLLVITLKSEIKVCGENGVASAVAIVASVAIAASEPATHLHRAIPGAFALVTRVHDRGRADTALAIPASAAIMAAEPVLGLHIDCP